MTRKALVVWGVGVFVYVVAVFHRTSLGVAGLDAAQRFHVGPAALGTFTVLQIGLYALMQVPTGLLVSATVLSSAMPPRTLESSPLTNPL